MGASSKVYRLRKVRRFVRQNLSQPPTRGRGRPPAMTDLDLLTAIIWDGLCEQHRTVRGMYDWLAREYSSRWPNLPTYETFLCHYQRLTPQISQLLKGCLKTTSPPDLCRFDPATSLC